MARPGKLSGSQLLAELGVGALNRTPEPLAPAVTQSQPTKVAGRPTKVIGKPVALSLRVSEDQLATLRKAAMVRAQAAGTTMVSPQDIVRLVLDRALADPEAFIASMADLGEESR